MVRQVKIFYSSVILYFRISQSSRLSPTKTFHDWLDRKHVVPFNGNTHFPRPSGKKGSGYETRKIVVKGSDRTKLLKDGG